MSNRLAVAILFTGCVAFAVLNPLTPVGGDVAQLMGIPEDQYGYLKLASMQVLVLAGLLFVRLRMVGPGARSPFTTVVTYLISFTVVVMLFCLVNSLLTRQGLSLLPRAGRPPILVSGLITVIWWVLAEVSLLYGLRQVSGRGHGGGRRSTAARSARGRKTS